ncbi:hypothetical protein T265_08848 [Opisthorchis viverrini]|uniref:Uncharacterized protein n=1 Tax=Opisthorchis viverrini TaxID=6198 RepID=A0A075A734_OPIVI|nr:hypothetical protein T265_08848 [Opisthorchis viverrini]KER23239.1 hypothetical protein T265_08848 [Opisthorchis viverrini]
MGNNTHVEELQAGEANYTDTSDVHTLIIQLWSATCSGKQPQSTIKIPRTSMGSKSPPCLVKKVNITQSHGKQVVKFGPEGSGGFQAEIMMKNLPDSVSKGSMPSIRKFLEF